ncbi:MAG: ammonia-forming cytochrome c nitrite reductase subunit c552 [Lachnospiraceae bacterium]|nr:ammonia-forming cytochrome c nitrite reductase subunit c552 [Lachnospiraceae bacterium]
MDKKRTLIKTIVSVVLVVGFALFVAGILNGKDLLYHLKNRDRIGPLTREDVDYVKADPVTPSGKDGTANANDYQTLYPEIVLSMKDNANNYDVTDYLEQDPYLVNIYEGFPFSEDYGSARGHEYTLEDVTKTQRKHPLANCLTCKSSNFAKLVNDMGVEAYKMDFNEAMALMEENISCYTCHGNEANDSGKLVVTHNYVTKALGEDHAGIDPSVLSCGQCHIEYYFTPTDKETMMPYHDVASMDPEAILKYYDAMEMPDGTVGFYDWVQPSTGTKMLKAQHPEMETFLMGKHAGALSCADCHMEFVMTEEGKVYMSHDLVSPLKNETILTTCYVCHKDVADMKVFVQRIQNRITARETEVGNRLSVFKDALAAAVSEGKMSEEELDAVRKLHREAQWFFDFCYVENAEGAHNSELATKCLDLSDERIAEGMKLLGLGE